MPTVGQNLIGGNWCPASGSSFESTDPASGEVLWTGFESIPEDVEAAIQAGKAAASGWQQTALEDRITILNAFREELTRQQDQLSLAISQEVGKPFWESKTEIAAMIGKIALTIEAFNERRSDQHFEFDSGTAMTRYRPHGLVAVFGPFNFPGHIANGHIAPALLAGNTVLFKPSEITPLVAELTVRCWEAADLPPGVLNLVQGGKETGVAIIEHPGINGVLFTGSVPAGIAISKALAARPDVLLALELGGNNPLIVDQVDDLDAAVYAVIQSAFLTSGQRCTCARRLILPPGNESFLQRLIEVIPKLTVGPHSQRPEPFMGPLVHSFAVDNVLNQQSRLIATGGESLLPALRVEFGETFLTPGLIDVTAVTDRPDEEVFGPLLQLVRVSSFEEAIAEANRTRFGLVAGLLSSDRSRFEKFSQQANAGLINWNRPTTGASGRLPFGGLGLSGNHRPAGYFMVDACNIPVASMQSPSLTIPAQRLPGVPL